MHYTLYLIQYPLCTYLGDNASQLVARNYGPLGGPGSMLDKPLSPQHVPVAYTTVHCIDK